MRVSSVAMFSYRSLHPLRVRPINSTLFIVTSGQHQLLVSRAYYLVILDDCSHRLWTFPLRLKSDTFSTLANFFVHVTTQYGATIKAVQCDNGREFDNSSAHTFFLTHGTHLRMSCPYTSSQNGKAERIIRSTNDIIRSLLF